MGAFFYCHDTFITSFGEERGNENKKNREHEYKDENEGI